MIKRIIKMIYIRIIKIIDKMVNSKPDNDNILIFMTFREDVQPIIKALNKENFKVTIIYHPKYEKVIGEFDVYKTINMRNKYFIQQIRSLKKARVVIIDTYYLLLGSITKPKNQTVIQTWHATGALKKFGLEDESIDLNNKKIINQYLDVYHYTDYYLIGSEIMGEIFVKSLDANPLNMLKIGLPRLDQYNKKEIKNIKNKLALYVPTYRDYNLNSNITIDKELFEQNCPGYELITKLHPAVPSNNGQENETRDIQTLLLLSDVVITDYSSLSIEAAYLDKPVIFFTYDEKEYNLKRGLNNYYYKMSEVNKAYTLNELYSLVNNLNNNSNIKKMWHTYNNGESTKLLLEFIKRKVE